MTPHAILPDSPTSDSFNMSASHNGAHPSSSSYRSHLTPTPATKLHDLICVGFGPASLAIGVAVHDALESGAPLKTHAPKIAFLERQPKFAWHGGMQIPGARMQISFSKDMATSRNPRSEFTFLNYLHANDRSVSFTNSNTFSPSRIEYEDYSRWCAGWFEDNVAYNEDVVGIESHKRGDGVVDSFSVTSRNNRTGQTATRRSKNVVIAVGGRPKIPACLPQKHPRVIHSSQFVTDAPRIFKDPNAPIRVAVIGSGQSAAEIFNNSPCQFPNSRNSLLIRGAALRPSDDSPFVNEIFDPDHVNDVFSQTPSVRSAQLAADKGTNYGVVRLESLEHIYSVLYSQRILHGSDESAWPSRLLPHREVSGLEEVGDGSGRVRLSIRNDESRYKQKKSDVLETLEVDSVVVASGYQRDVHESLSAGCRELMPQGGREGEKWAVGRDYRVSFGEGKVDAQAGVWSQGCNEKTHGLSDTLLSVLANRGGEMVDSMFGTCDTVAKKAGLNGH